MLHIFLIISEQIRQLDELDIFFQFLIGITSTCTQMIASSQTIQSCFSQWKRKRWTTNVSNKQVYRWTTCETKKPILDKKLTSLKKSAHSRGSPSMAASPMGDSDETTSAPGAAGGQAAAEQRWESSEDFHFAGAFLGKVQRTWLNFWCTLKRTLKAGLKGIYIQIKAATVKAKDEDDGDMRVEASCIYQILPNVGFPGMAGCTFLERSKLTREVLGFQASNCWSVGIFWTPKAWGFRDIRCGRAPCCWKKKKTKYSKSP